MSYKLPEGFEPSTYALRMRRTADCATEASCEVLHHARPESNRIRLRTRTALHLTGLPSSLRTDFTERTHGQRTGKQQQISIHLCLSRQPIVSGNSSRIKGYIICVTNACVCNSNPYSISPNTYGRSSVSVM